MGQTATIIAATASIGVAAVLIAGVIAGVVASQAYRQERLCGLRRQRGCARTGRRRVCA